MPRKLLDLTGQRFGKLTVLREGERAGKHRRWVCRCECGAIKLVGQDKLRGGRTRTCGGSCRAWVDLKGQRFGELLVTGEAEPLYPDKSLKASRRWWCQCLCGRVEKKSQTDLRNGYYTRCTKCNGRPQHGKSDTSIYEVYHAMLSRCYAFSNISYSSYGGRGIVVCDRWRFGEGDLSGFECFLADMPPQPTPEHTIERADNNGHYEPGNIKWATMVEQGRNTRRTNYVRVSGKERKVIDLAEALGISSSQLLCKRLQRYSLEEVITRAVWFDAKQRLPQHIRLRPETELATIYRKKGKGATATARSFRS